MKIEKQPLERILIHFVHKTDFNSMVDMLSIGVPPGGVTHPIWCAGKIALVYSQLPWGDTTLQDYINGGKLHIDTLAYAVTDGNAGKGGYYEHGVSKIRVPYFNAEANELAKALYDWIMEQEK